MIIINP